jgi:hypothetical protein
MKTKIIVAMVAVVACNQLVWGQMMFNNAIPRAGQQVGTPSIEQAVLSYFKGLTNLTQIEADAINRFAYQVMETPRRVLPDDQPENYQRMTEVQKAIFGILFYSAKEVEGNTANNIERLNGWKHARPLWLKTVPKHPWRKINGKTIYVLSPGSGFQNCYGTIIQTVNGGVLVKPPLNISGDYFIKNFPFQAPDGYEMDGENFMAIEVGVKTFTTVLGAGRTVTELDYGEPCERPKGGEKIEAEALAPPPGAQIQAQKIESEITENRNAASAAKKRVADFVQQIEDDKIMAVVKRKQHQDLMKETAKQNALKFNQDLADKGDAYGLFRMGERYRDGEGVPKDFTKARDYLTKAAAAGSPTAEDDLKKLPSNQN